MWRSAYDGELDYRATKDLSQNFVDILEKVAKSKFEGEHNATLDLLVGIAIGKIRLVNEHLALLITKLRTNFSSLSEFTEILEHIEKTFILPSEIKSEGETII